MKINVTPEELGSILSEVDHGKPTERRCPLCAEIVQSAAIKCKHCGSRIDGSAQPIGAGAVLGIICFAVVVLIVMFRAGAQWTLIETQPKMVIAAVWTSLISLGMIAIFVGTLLRARWGYSWAVGTSVLQAIGLTQIVLSNLQAFMSDNPAVLGMFVVGAATATIAAIALRSASKRLFTGDYAAGKADTWLTVVLIALSFVVDSLAK